MKIAHLEFGRHRYGGAQQVLYLLGALANDRHQHLLIAPLGSAVATVARQAGHEVVELSLAGEHDVGAIFRLAGLLRETKVDLLHVHSRRGADWMGAIAARRAGIKAILTRRVDNPPGWWMRRIISRSFVRVVCISQAIEQVLLASGLAQSQLITIRSALDASDYEGAADEQALEAVIGRAPRGPVIAVAAQMIERKGHAYLLAAMADIRAAVPQVEVVFFGRGPLERKLRTEVSERSLNDVVHFAGFRDDLPALLGACTLLVHPATAEGLGVVLLQAAAARVSVVGFAAGGVSEAVAHEQTGLLVESGNVRELARAIIRLLTDDTLRHQLADQGHQRIVESFSVQTMASAYESLYTVLSEAG